MITRLSIYPCFLLLISSSLFSLSFPLVLNLPMTLTWTEAESGMVFGGKVMGIRFTTAPLDEEEDEEEEG